MKKQDYIEETRKKAQILETWMKSGNKEKLDDFVYGSETKDNKEMSELIETAKNFWVNFHVLYKKAKSSSPRTRTWNLAEESFTLVGILFSY